MYGTGFDPCPKYHKVPSVGLSYYFYCLIRILIPKHRIKISSLLMSVPTILTDHCYVLSEP